jgi:hypothetical protein
VPLSEDEQRILDEIERSFYKHDPAFARNVSTATLTRQAGRNCKLAALVFIVGLVILLTEFANVFWLGAIGFLVMLGSAFVFATNFRRLSKETFQQARRSIRLGNFGTALGDQRRRFRERFKRDE